MFTNKSVSPTAKLLSAEPRNKSDLANLASLLVVLFIAGSCASTSNAKIYSSETELKKIYQLAVFPDTSEAIKTYSFQGTVEHAGLSGTFSSYYDYQWGYRSTTDMGLFSVSQGFEGKVGWEANTNGIIKGISRIGEDILVLTRIIESREYLSASEAVLMRVCLGPTEFAGRGVYEFSIATEKGITGEIFIDSLNGDVLGMHMQHDLADANVVFSDFREVDGVSFAFQSELTANLSELNMITQTVSAEVNQAIPAETFTRPETITNNVSFPSNTDSLVAKLEYYRGHLYFRMSINGSEPRLFLLDSGAGGMVIDEYHAESLGIDPVGSQSGLGIGGSAEFSFAIVDELNLEGIILKDQFFAVLDFGSNMRNAFRGIVGIIGYDFFARFIVTVDYELERMTIFPPSKEFLETTTAVIAVLPMEFYATIPTVSVAVNGKQGEFLVDIGSRYEPLLHESFVLANSFEDLPHRENPNDNGYIGGVGGGLPTKAVTLASFDFATLQVQNQPARTILGSAGAAASTTLAGNIGNGFLDQYRITFDYPHKRIILQDRIGN